MRRTVLLLSLLLSLTFFACHHSSAEGKRYSMEGTVKELDASTQTAVIDAGQIGDWMEPMTMPYQVKPADEYKKLHVGDRIQATVVVNDPSYYVTDVKVLPKK